MILTDGTSLTTQNVSPHKFGGDVMAEYLWYLSMHRGEDESSGNVECTTGWFARFGKRILRSNDQGFVWCEKFRTEAGAKRVFDAIDAYYCAWDYDEDGETWDDSDDAQHAREAELDRLDDLIGVAYKEAE